MKKKKPTKDEFISKWLTCWLVMTGPKQDTTMFRKLLDTMYEEEFGKGALKAYNEGKLK